MMLNDYVGVVVDDSTLSSDDVRPPTMLDVCLFSEYDKIVGG